MFFFFVLCITIFAKSLPCVELTNLYTFRSNFLKLDVYYAALQKKTTDQVAAYEAMDFVGKYIGYNVMRNHQPDKLRDDSVDMMRYVNDISSAVFILITNGVFSTYVKRIESYKLNFHRLLRSAPTDIVVVLFVCPFFLSICPSRTTLPLKHSQRVSDIVLNLIGRCTVPWSRSLCKMAILDHFLRDPRNLRFAKIVRPRVCCYLNVLTT